MNWVQGNLFVLFRWRRVIQVALDVLLNPMESFALFWFTLVVKIYFLKIIGAFHFFVVASFIRLAGRHFVAVIPFGCAIVLIKAS